MPGADEAARGAGEAPPGAGETALADAAAELVRRRTDAGARFFPAEAPRLATLCHQLAERFARGGRLFAIGRSPAARSDARHVAVEFVHPVIVGKRALPAVALTAELGRQAELLLRPEDIVLGFGVEEDGGEAARALVSARTRGCLTVSFAPAGAEWELEPPSDDAFVRQELIETLYHVLWELVHVFFEHRGLLAGRHGRRAHDAGASSFLYPFLAEQEANLEEVLADVRDSVMMKAEEVDALRSQTVRENGHVLAAAAAALARSFAEGGKLLALGNGGSATDAMDAVADFASGPRPRPALDLGADPAILTAIANDIGVVAMFSRQVIAYGEPGDALLAISTSGNSENVIDAVAEARRRQMVTVALVGYDGGRIAAGLLADHVIVTRSQHIPRIQEAQATAYHILRELVDRAEPGDDRAR